MSKVFYPVWNSMYGSAFYRDEYASNDLVVIIANGGILSPSGAEKLIKNTKKIQGYSALECHQINYFIYWHKSACANLQIAGQDLSEFINYVQSSYKYKTILLVTFSKANIAGYYAITSGKVKNVERLRFIAGAAPWRGTALCDGQELKKIPSKLPTKVVEIIVKICLRTNLEKDLSPNSESIRKINFKELNSIIDTQYDTSIGNYRSEKLQDMFPDMFVRWAFKGYFSDGVIPIASQKSTDVKHVLIETTHFSALKKIIDDICLHLD